MSLTFHTHCGYGMIKIHVSRYWYKFNFVTIYRWAEMGFNEINRYTNSDKHSLQWRLWLDTVTLLSGPVTKMYCARACVFTTTCSGGVWRRALTTWKGCVSICLCIWRVPLCHTVGKVPLCHTVGTVPLCHAVCAVHLWHTVQFPCATLYLQSYDGSIFEPKNVMR